MQRRPKPFWANTPPKNEIFMIKKTQRITRKNRRNITEMLNFLLFLPELGCHQEVTASSLRGVVTRHKKTEIKKKSHSHSHSPPTTAQTRVGTLGEVQPDKGSAFR